MTRALCLLISLLAVGCGGETPMVIGGNDVSPTMVVRFGYGYAPSTDSIQKLYPNSTVVRYDWLSPDTISCRDTVVATAVIDYPIPTSDTIPVRHYVGQCNAVVDIERGEFYRNDTIFAVREGRRYAEFVDELRYSICSR